MRAENYIGCLIMLTFVLFGSLAAADTKNPTATVDHGIYASLLKKYVKKGHVNYQGFKNEEAELDEYLKVLENTDVNSLSSSERFAYYVNAYNAWTIKLILSGYPGINSIKELGSFIKTPWKKKIVRSEGTLLTLDDIEHNILRPMFKDPRIHFAINCAAFSCPPLRSEPYQGKILDQQLNDSTRVFINNPKRNYLEGNTLYVSKIFKWFAEDFDHDVVGFVSAYAEGDFKKQLDIKKDILKVKYLYYDWSLNGS
jgi:hypothetical protein